MKNLFLLPTDKPSRLWVNNLKRRLEIDKDVLIGSNTAQHIYITNSDEIKEGDWIFSTKTNNLFKADSIEYLESHNMIEDFDKSFYINSKYAKKIILTTDQSLDGVQAIDDTFLEWFVKNPSCEEVEANKLYYGALSGFADAGYKIIIPQEKPKQETLEEFISKEGFHDKESNEIWELGVKQCSNWQAEQILNFITNEDNYTERELGNSCIDVQTLIKFIIKLKKK